MIGAPLEAMKKEAGPGMRVIAGDRACRPPAPEAVEAAVAAVEAEEAVSEVGEHR